MTALADACQALTEPWAEILPPDDDRTGYQVIEHKPRILMLADMIGSDVGGSTGGASLPSNRNLLNTGAFDLWQRIDQGAREALHLAGSVPHRGLPAAIAQLGTVADTLRESNGMTETAHTRLTARVEKWRADIENLLDPPTKKEIRGTCPNCSEARVYTADGETWALVAYYWRGRDVAADCQACGHHWQGDRALLELGEAIGSEVNYVELRAQGVGA